MQWGEEATVNGYTFGPLVNTGAWSPITGDDLVDSFLCLGCTHGLPSETKAKEILADLEKTYKNKPYRVWLERVAYIRKKESENRKKTTLSPEMMERFNLLCESVEKARADSRKLSEIADELKSELKALRMSGR